MAGMRVMCGADSDLVGLSGEKNHLGNDGLDVRLILKWILQCANVGCNHLDRNTALWYAVTFAVKEFAVG